MKIMQCWDDGVTNDERLIGLLSKYGAKATFNINPGLHKQSERYQGSHVFKGIYPTSKLCLDEMKDLYSDFTIAGHATAHANLPDIVEFPERLRAELVNCYEYLAKTFNQEKMGFAYPCGRYDDASKQAVKDAGYLYARTCENVDGALPLDDPMALPSHCHFMNENFWTKYEQVRKADGVFYFWGHSYEMMDDQELWDQFEEKLARIQSDDKAEWIDIIDLF